MIETRFRPHYQFLLVDPIAKMVKNIPPEYITYLACLTGITIVPALLFNATRVATLLLLLTGFLDTLDGTVARLAGKTSEIGCALDIISDRVVELAIIMGLCAIDPTHRSWLALGMLGSCYLCVTSFLIVGIYTSNSSVKGFFYSEGLIERAEAFLFFLAMIWLPGYFNFLAILFIGLVLMTAYLHIKKFMKIQS